MKKYHIGYTCGVFDLFHVGHLNLLERCKALCDILIVGICNDDYVRNIKKKEPVYSEEDRVRIIKSLKCVDDAVLVDIETTNDKMLALHKIHFDVLFSGDDWKGSERYIKQRHSLHLWAYALSISPIPPVSPLPKQKRKFRRHVKLFATQSNTNSSIQKFFHLARL